MAGPTHAWKRCTNCGAQNDPQNSFCGSCGAPLASSGGDSDDHSLDGTSDLGKRSSPLGELSVDRIRPLSTEPTWEAMLGSLLAVGVAMFAKVPPVPALLGLGGSMEIDPPITSIALLPFVLMLAGSWVLSSRERTSVVFALVATASYSVILAVLALPFQVTSSGEGAEITVSAAPL